MLLSSSPASWSGEGCFSFYVSYISFRRNLFYLQDIEIKKGDGIIILTLATPYPHKNIGITIDITKYLKKNCYDLDVINNDMDRLKMRLDTVVPTADTPLNNRNYWMPEYRKYLSDFANSTRTQYIEDNLGYVTTKLEQELNKNIVE